MPEKQQGEEIYRELLKNRDKGGKYLLSTFAPKWKGFLYNRYWPSLQDSDFEEIISTALNKICNNLDSYDKERGSFWKWTFTIMLNAAKDYIECAKKGIQSMNLTQEEWRIRSVPSNPQDKEKNPPTLSPEEVRTISNAFAKLSTNQQDVLRIVAEHEDIPAKEIAKMLDTSTGNIGQLKKRAKDKMKTALKDLKLSKRK